MEAHAEFVPFTAQTRMSGVDLDGSEIRKGAVDAIVGWSGHDLPAELDDDGRAHRAGGRHAARRRARTTSPLGVIELKDIIKDGLVERFDQLRQMGIRTVMITGDNPLTAAAIAAGVRRRRLPRRGDARDQDGPDQARSRRAACSSR